MKLALFEQFIQEFTYVDEELNPEERQQILQARLTNGKCIEIICKSYLSCLFTLVNLKESERKAEGDRVFEGLCCV